MNHTQSYSHKDQLRTSRNNMTNTVQGKPETQTLNNWLSSVGSERDKKAFASLFRHFAPKLRQGAMQKLQNEAQAMDVVQEVMSRVWRKAHLYSPDKGAATTWIYTVMRNVIFDLLRKVKNQQVESLSDDIWPIEESQASEEEIADHILSRRLDHYVSRLPAKQQEALKAVYYQQLTHEQLAKQLDLPVGTVKSRIRLAVSKLKQQLGAEHD